MKTLSYLTLLLVVYLCYTNDLLRPTDRAIKKFKSWKFGLFLHYGIYANLKPMPNCGDVCSWPLSWNDRTWANHNVTTKEEMIKFREYYWGLSSIFNPVEFDPNVWADAAQAAGIKYFVMTTKHCDGFSTFNTKLDDYSVVGSQCPFKKDIFGATVEAFRKKGMGVGAYYCKADFHRKDYWNPTVFAESVHANYDSMKNTTLWNSYSQFVRGQLQEITDLYNPDILWLDGGWTNAPREDLRLDITAKYARGKNRDILIVNRGNGYFEDYLTPEFLTQAGPGYNPLSGQDFKKPWESCMTMGTQWGYIRNDDYKTSAHLIDILTTVVSTGGNLLLDIGPGPDGKLPENALSRLRDIASWMKINGESIHDTEPLFPYTQWMETMDASTVLKLTRKDRVIYLTTMLSNGDVDVPDTTYVTFAYQNSFGDLDNYTVGHIELLGSTVPVKFDFVNDFLHIYVPSGTASPSSYAYVFKITE